MALDRLSIIFRILDGETRLIERADQKAISLLSILGVFMVFFIVYYRVIPVNPLTVTLVAVYILFAVSAIVNLLLVIRPRLRKIEQGEDGNRGLACDPTVFIGICRFPSESAYKECLEAITSDSSAMTNIYISQIFTLAQINAVKYRHAQWGTLMVVITLVVELSLIVYLFANYMGEGVMPR